MTLILDLETAPQARVLALPYPKAEREPPKNYSKPEAIAGWYAKDEAQWKADLAKTAALNPRLGRIVAVGMQITGGRAHSTVNLDETGERELVRVALDCIHSADSLVTFNGLGFDLPYLHVRAAILGLRVPYRTGDYLRRYSAHPHADLAMILSNYAWGKEGDTLHGWCEAFGIPVTDNTTGAEIGAAVERGDTEFVRTHCEADVTTTAQLAARLTAAGLL